FARMRISGDLRPGEEIPAHLDGLASGDAEIVPLEFGALDGSLLRVRHAQRRAACDDQQRYCADSNRFHVSLLSSFRYASVNPCSLLAGFWRGRRGFVSVSRVGNA